MSLETETGEFRLGERSFKIRALTFDQLQAVIELFPETTGAFSTGAFRASRRIIAAALSDQVPAAEIGDLRASLPQVLVAVGEIARVTGLAQLGEALRGMTGAAGMPSTQAS